MVQLYLMSKQIIQTHRSGSITYIRFSKTNEKRAYVSLHLVKVKPFSLINTLSQRVNSKGKNSKLTYNSSSVVHLDQVESPFKSNFLHLWHLKHVPNIFSADITRRDFFFFYSILHVMGCNLTVDEERLQTGHRYLTTSTKNAIGQYIDFN